jgi:hypothetical protein
MSVPYEEQAYQLEGRYTRDPKDVFSVEEVRAWLKRGDFRKRSMQVFSGWLRTRDGQ